jgi:hypothetical protein
VGVDAELVAEAAVEGATAEAVEEDADRVGGLGRRRGRYHDAGPDGAAGPLRRIEVVVRRLLQQQAQVVGARVALDDPRPGRGDAVPDLELEVEPGLVLAVGGGDVDRPDPAALREVGGEAEPSSRLVEHRPRRQAGHEDAHRIAVEVRHHQAEVQGLLLVHGRPAGVGEARGCVADGERQGRRGEVAAAQAELDAAAGEGGQLGHRRVAVDHAGRARLAVQEEDIAVGEAGAVGDELEGPSAGGRVRLEPVEARVRQGAADLEGDGAGDHVAAVVGGEHGAQVEARGARGRLPLEGAGRRVEAAARRAPCEGEPDRIGVEIGGRDREAGGGRGADELTAWELEARRGVAELQSQGLARRLTAQDADRVDPARARRELRSKPLAVEPLGAQGHAVEAQAIAVGEPGARGDEEEGPPARARVRLQRDESGRRRGHGLARAAGGGEQAADEGGGAPGAPGPGRGAHREMVCGRRSAGQARR